MLSFFSKKKNSAETPPEEIIQGPGETQDNHSDDFIFVEKRNNDAPSGSQSNLYPPMPPTYGITPNPYPPAGGAATVRGAQAFIPYMQDVPFVLAPHLFSKNKFDFTQTQVDGILAFLTRQMSLDEEKDYSFTLERSIQNEVE